MKKEVIMSAFLGLACTGILLSSCSENNDDPSSKPDRTTTDEMYYANQFARDMLETYYYWNKEIAGDLPLLDPETNNDPITTVDQIKYHEDDKVIDKWTMLTNDFKSFTSGVEGVATTYGYMPVTYLLSEQGNECISAIAYVHKGSPAEKAGLKRGDLIYQIDGKPLTTANYTELFNSSSITLSLAELGADNVITPTGKTVSMNAVEMYEDPILCDSIYDINGKKVGYLAYSSFDLASIPQLVEISKKFKAEGVKELILDLRYNGGGYVITESAMASMYAPQEAVSSKKIFEKEEYNDLLTAYYEQEGISTETPFQTEYKVESANLNISTKDANIGLEKVYGIISGNSASASEALLSGLMPYMNVELIGEQSHGKYCTGFMLGTSDVYEKVPAAIENWGIYVMVSIYKNANNETPCMPDGLTPDVAASDDPFVMTQLGDVNEAMLKTALTQAGKTYPAGQNSRSMNLRMKEMPMQRKANFGKRILLPATAHIQHQGLTAE